MPGLLTNTTNVTIEQITDIANSTRPEEFLVKLNTHVFGGVYWFVMLWVMWVILFVVANKVKDQPLNNAMYSGAVVSILAIILRGITWTIDGVSTGLLTDHLMWVFPIITVLLATVIWAIKD